ncbi:MAG: DUF1302 domain-containing protein [Gammaproteobacteria bacterium]|nr:DUF1302 domain-containing protein [Gammaproteobacteria bacterium]
MHRLLVLLLYLVSLGVEAATPGLDLDFEFPSSIDVPTEKNNLIKYDFGGYVKNETAYRFDEPRIYTKIRNILQLKNEVSIGKWSKFVATGWGYYDSVYDVFDEETIAARYVREEKEVLTFVELIIAGQERDQKRAELRELYLDLYIKNLDLRIGKQYVIWGVLEGMRIVDEINPMDFRELILPGLLDYRIPLWTLKADYYGENASLQLLWIPELKFHQPAVKGSEWELFQVLPSTTQPNNFDPMYSEFGVRLSTRINETDLALSYFYTWDDYPATFRIISIDDVTSVETSNELAILPTYTRMTMYGLTATREIGGDILKAEFAYVTGKYFAIEDHYEDGFLVSDGEVQRDHIRWGIGYDFSLWGADFSPSISQWMILDYSPDILSRRFDTTFNVFLRKPLQKQSAVFTLLYIRLIEFQEDYIKPKITFNLTNQFQVMFGLDLFTGNRTQFGRAFSTIDPGGLTDVEQRAQFLGNFRDNRRVFLEFKYDF